MLCPKCAREIPNDAALCCYCGRAIQRKAPSRVHQRANGSGTAIKRGKTWTADVTIGWTIDEIGKKHRHRVRKGGFKTRIEALNYCATLFDRRNVKKAPNLAACWESYSTGEMDKLSDSKRTAYKIAWNKLKPLWLRPIDSLTVADLRRVVKENAGTYYPAHDMKVLLSHLFTLGAADGWCSKDLPSFIVLPEKNETAREPFTEAEQAAIWRAYESGCSDAAIPLIMIYTGMMTGEMQRLTASMIDFDNRRITGVGLKTAVRKAAPVYLPDAIIPVLQDAAQGKTGRLYPCSEDTFYARYYAALDAAGVRRLTPYSCRHTTATALAISENIAPETVRKVMRWSTTAMLSRYAHPDDTDALAAVNRLRRQHNDPEASPAL